MSFPVKYSVDWQCTCLLLYALRPLSSGATKEIVLSKIEDEKWLSLQQEDYDPYPSAWYHNSPEPRWMTLIGSSGNLMADVGEGESKKRG